MNNKIKYGVAILLSTIIVIAVYYGLGGAEPLVFDKETRPMLKVYGKPFEGEYTDPTIEKLFTEAREFALANEDATLAIINYNTSDEDSVKQFIGFISDKDYDKMFVEMKEVTFVKTKINAHNLVMPRPDKVLEEATAFASENGLKLDQLSIEVYHKESDLEVLFPCKVE
ncbi:MAG: hypothetical protein RLO12_10130 [Fulvivirga sp.]